MYDVASACLIADRSNGALVDPRQALREMTRDRAGGVDFGVGVGRGLAGKSAALKASNEFGVAQVGEAINACADNRL